MIEKVEHQGCLLAIIVRRDYRAAGIHFFTPNDFSQQLAYMSHPAGKRIAPHRHNAVPREVHFTQEVLVIKTGVLRTDFYGMDREYLFSRMLRAGDVILLADGGHGFEVIEPVEMYEIKQGPYAGEADKTRFEAVDSSKVIFE
jgi:hypothetical protein